ncbi:hypothetical protein ACVILI_005997 [Mesorhizobium sp. USDA 4775]
MVATPDQLEDAIRRLTGPLDGWYLRPWMTSLSSPSSATVFTVGRNQHTGYRAEHVGSLDHYIDTLFNRGSETCRGLYDRLTGSPTPTRRNTDRLVQLLAKNGVTDVLETNVTCYSTPTSAALKNPIHARGAKLGQEIFETLLRLIRPQILIAHGSGTAKQLARVLKCSLPKPPQHPSELVTLAVGTMTVIVIPSLAPPRFTGWAKWSDEHLEIVSAHVARLCNRPQVETD